MIAMKGAISNEERIQAENALAILGGGGLRIGQAGAIRRGGEPLGLLARKERTTPDSFPRRAGIPVRRPLGG